MEATIMGSDDEEYGMVQEGGGNKKTMYIGIGVVAVLGLAAILYYCFCSAGGHASPLDALMEAQRAVSKAEHDLNTKKQQFQQTPAGMQNPAALQGLLAAVKQDQDGQNMGAVPAPETTFAAFKAQLEPAGGAPMPGQPMPGQPMPGMMPGQPGAPQMPGMMPGQPGAPQMPGQMPPGMMMPAPPAAPGAPVQLPQQQMPGQPMQAPQQQMAVGADGVPAQAMPAAPQAPAAPTP